MTHVAATVKQGVHCSLPSGKYETEFLRNWVIASMLQGLFVVQTLVKLVTT